MSLISSKLPLKIGEFIGPVNMLDNNAENPDTIGAIQE